MIDGGGLVRRGNDAVLVQCKLMVGRADDVHEREADRVADLVMGRIGRITHTDALAETLPVTRSGKIQRSTEAAAGAGGGELGPVMASRIRRSSGGGAALDDTVRSTMERAFGANFADVRIHRDSDLAPQLGAVAFTQGTDLHFAPGRFDVASTSGQRLLAHELTHVVQQNGSVARSPAASADVVQRALVTVPTVAANRGVMNGLAGAAPADMGNTSPPGGYTVPAYVINTAAAGGGFSATVVKTANADDGNNFSRYLGAGIHSTGLMRVGTALGPYAAGQDNREIYAEASGAIATVNRAAEQEHVDDFLRAYQISLRMAEDAIDAAVLNGPFAGHPTAPAAQAAAETFMNNHINAAAIVAGSAPFVITANLDQLFQDKMALSMQRDGNGWHTFRPDMTATSWSAAALWEELTSGRTHEVRNLLQGPTMAVGVHATATQIV